MGVRQRAASHRDLYAPTRIFSCNTALKSHGRRQPCRGSLSCLTEKSRPLECFAVLNRRFFLRGVSGDCRNTICISKSTDAPLGKKIHSKPCKSLCESAQCRTLFYVRSPKIVSRNSASSHCCPARISNSLPHSGSFFRISNSCASICARRQLFSGKSRSNSFVTFICTG